MAKRLQVILQDTEYRKIQRAAHLRHLSVAEWVREALQLARRRESTRSVDARVKVIRAAARHQFPNSRY